MEMFFCEFKGIQHVDKLYITPRALTSRNSISKRLREKKIFQHQISTRKKVWPSINIRLSEMM